MTDPSREPPSGVERAKLAFRRTYAEVEGAIIALEPDDAFREATALLADAEGVVRDAAMLRARMARRFVEEAGMTLSQLAERIGTSKSRADQLVRAARAHDQL